MSSDKTEFERRNTMKKLITLALALTIIASIFILPSSAITDTEVANYKYTVIMQAMNGFNSTADDVHFFAKYSMRGMAISQDGKYAFGGYLNPNGTSAIEMTEIATGKVVSGIQYIQPENGKSSYPKGLATDDRGYLYAALAYNPNNTRADIATYTYADNTLKQIGYANVVTTNESVKTGVNGITVEKINGSYYAYVVVNYDVDYLARLNVDDPTNPVLDTSFGENGLIDLQKEPYSLKEANYLDVDTDGTIYLACNGQSDKKVLILSSDGSLILNQIVHDTAYGVAVWGNYLFVTTQKTGKIGIYDKTLLTLVASIEITSDNMSLPISRDDILINAGVSSLCNVAVVDDVLFIGDQSDGQSGIDQILAVGLTTEAAAKVASWSAAIADRLAAAYPEKTEAPETTVAPATDETTAEPAAETTTEDTAPDTSADASANTTAGAGEKTEAPDNTTAPATESKGCGGMVAGIAIIAIIGSALIIRKKD